MKENACQEQNFLNKRECTSRTLPRFYMKENARWKHYEREHEIIRRRSY